MVLPKQTNKGQNMGKQSIILYRTPDGATEIRLRAEDGSVWLTQAEIADLFQTTKQNVSLHFKNIFQRAELEEDSVVKESLITAADKKAYRFIIIFCGTILGQSLAVLDRGQ